MPNEQSAQQTLLEFLYNNPKVFRIAFQHNVLEFSAQILNPPDTSPKYRIYAFVFTRLCPDWYEGAVILTWMKGEQLQPTNLYRGGSTPSTEDLLHHFGIRQAKQAKELHALFLPIFPLFVEATNPPKL